VVLGFYSITVPPFPALEQSRLVGAEATMNFRLRAPKPRDCPISNHAGASSNASPHCAFSAYRTGLENSEECLAGALRHNQSCHDLHAQRDLACNFLEQISHQVGLQNVYKIL
jgi:hypothetical protein